jgi:hypothetical protein
MTKDIALKLLAEYAAVFKEAGEDDKTITEIAQRFPEEGSEAKAMRWLGFMQGIVYDRKLCTLEQIKAHSMKQEVDPEDFEFPVRRSPLDIYNERIAQMQDDEDE